ncbi:MAG: branched-chain amino acid transaminase [archaeon]
MEETKLIWMNNKMTPWHECKTHFLTHTAHYGSGVFEGVRCYNTEKGPAIFRLDEHIQRLFYSASVFGIKIPYTEKELIEACIKVIKENELKSGYIRPLVFYGYGKMGLDTIGAKIEVGIAAWPWEAYLGKEGIEKGVSVKISPFIRPSRDVMPTNAKVTGNYANSIMAKMDALNTGFKDAILLDKNKNVAECSAENFFMVKKKVLITPSTENCLEGITRKSVIEIAKDLGVKVDERIIPSKELFKAEEAFMTGTAAEISPITSIDGKAIGLGKPGKITQKIQKKFYDAVSGKEKKYLKWLTYVK